MKNKIKEFFKSKLNITLFSLQVLALAFLCFVNIWSWTFIIVLLAEGMFFIFFGVKYLYNNKELDKNLALEEKITIENIDIDKQKKRNKMIKKSNILQAVLFWLMGLCLIVIAII